MEKIKAILTNTKKKALVVTDEQQKQAKEVCF